MVRARRRARLSQREMAEELGVARSTLASYERGSRRVPEGAFAAALAVGGLRLAVLDEEGREIEPFPSDAVRDNAGRRFPAHLEVQPPDKLPREALRAPRYDREAPRAWYHLRGSDEVSLDDLGGRDHPTDHELALRLRRLRTAGAVRRMLALPDEPDACSGEGDRRD
ncbi:helix-turn-helix transcriptional regulator [Pedococcus sp. KACC 23699]|uniref:Helix-turn-helix transcriptional regulator n=1 Tax=Pedococcus sp. KACC 23699 TaxID=3149228 RepID=A0AAU7JZW3_9MICO